MLLFLFIFLFRSQSGPLSTIAASHSHVPILETRIASNALTYTLLCVDSTEAHTNENACHGRDARQAPTLG